MIETVRCFVACDLSGQVVRALTDGQRDLAEALGGEPAIRWVSPTTLHLSVKFLGDRLDKGVTVAIADALAHSGHGAAPFALDLRGLGAFPTAERARVVWAGVQEESGALRAAWEAVETTMADIGFEADDRAFRPHVTLGRVKDRQGRYDLAAALEPFAGRDFGRCEVTDLVLYRSVLGPHGPRYEAMVRAPLTGSATNPPPRSTEQETTAP